MADLVISLSAQAEIEQAILWYENESSGLGNVFFDNLYDTLDFIADNPEASPLKFDNFHCKVMQVFPFLIFYQLNSDTVEVIAVAHQKRKPGYWQQPQDKK